MEESRHPFLEGLSKHRGVPPTVVVIFGASGDLAARKLIPAIYNLSVDNLLPNNFRLIGFGRKLISNQEFRRLMREALENHSRRSLKDEIWDKLEKLITYQSSDYADLDSYKNLFQSINNTEKEFGIKLQRIFYISTPPTVFNPILSCLGESGLAKSNLGMAEESKVIIEKPFGRDLESAQKLNSLCNQVFQERQVYRIDHYLGKETVQDLLVQRFSNSIFEPVWNYKYVDCVQITVSEKLGVGARGGYYDESGALRDMIQNHTMQLVALTAMEQPKSLTPESIRDEKVKVIRSIKKLRLDKNDSDVVRAYYTEGMINGKNVNAYIDESEIPNQTNTETYVAMRLFINNKRWKGVPFYIRSGKRMAMRTSEIAIKFKRPLGGLFPQGGKFNLTDNTIVIQIQPNEGVTLIMNSKVPGLETRMQPVKMHFRYSTTFGSNTPEAYERLILDAMIGDRTLFIRGDETEASWKLLSPVLEYWNKVGSDRLYEYPAGSWGPDQSDDLLAKFKHEWRHSG